MANPGICCVISAVMAMIVAAVPARAGEKQGRIVSMVVSQDYERAHIKVEGAGIYPSEPVCSQQVSSHDFVLNISTPVGKAIYALALAAQSSQAVVSLTHVRG